MSPVEQCRECHRLFPFLARGVCAECIENTERQFEVVREWLRGNAGATTRAAAEATDVPEAKIAAWLRDGRLERYSLGTTDAEEERRRDELRSKLVVSMRATETSAAADPASESEPRSAGMRTRGGR